MFVNSFVFSSFSSVKNYADLILMRLDSEFIAQNKYTRKGVRTHSYSLAPSICAVRLLLLSPVSIRSSIRRETNRVEKCFKKRGAAAG